MNLKTITDEGKRELKEYCNKTGMGGLNRFSLHPFLEAYAEKVATETMRAILPPEAPSDFKLFVLQGHGWKSARDYSIAAFQTFLGKV